MTPEERDLIGGLFDRMYQQGAGTKDREAEDFINYAMSEVPDAGYMLVQSVLVQDHALQQADERIRELEARVKELEGGTGGARSSAGGSFLGGGKSFRSGQASGSSVPSMRPGEASSAPSSAARPRSADLPWERVETTKPAGQAPSASVPQQPQQAPSRGGGFLKAAMATAAGVAGGMLLSDSIKGMLGGGSAGSAHAAGSNSNLGRDSPLGLPSDSASSSEAFDNDPGSFDNSADFGGDDYEF